MPVIVPSFGVLCLCVLLSFCHHCHECALMSVIDAWDCSFFVSPVPMSVNFLKSFMPVAVLFFLISMPMNIPVFRHQCLWVYLSFIHVSELFFILAVSILAAFIHASESSCLFHWRLWVLLIFLSSMCVSIPSCPSSIHVTVHFLHHACKCSLLSFTHACQCSFLYSYIPMSVLSISSLIPLSFVFLFHLRVTV